MMTENHSGINDFGEKLSMGVTKERSSLFELLYGSFLALPEAIQKRIQCYVFLGQHKRIVADGFGNVFSQPKTYHEL